MSLNPKPFTASEKIRNRLYLPNPGRITAVDLNQEKEAIVGSIEFLSKYLGSYQNNYTASVNSLTLVKTLGPTTYTLNYDISFGGGFRRVFGKTVRFDAPVLNFASSIADVTPPLIEWWLIAKKETIDFATDPVMSGVNGPGFPSALSSSDTVIWSNEDILQVTTSPLPALSLGYEYICKVGSVIYKDERYLATASDWVPVFVSLPETGNSTSNDLIDLHGAQSIQPLGSKATSIGEVIQRLSLVLGSAMSRIPFLSRFSGIISSSTTVTLTTSDIKKQVYFQSQVAEVTCELPLTSNPALLDLSTYSIYNYGDYAVGIKPLSGTIMGQAYYYLSSKNESIEIIYDKANTNWKIVNSSINRRFTNTKSTSVGAVLDSSDFNKIIDAELLAGNIQITLPFTNAISGTNPSHFGQNIVIRHKTPFVSHSVRVRPFIPGNIDGSGDFFLYQDGDFVELCVVDPANNGWAVVAHKSTPIVPPATPTNPVFYRYSTPINIGASGNSVLKFPTVVVDAGSQFDVVSGHLILDRTGLHLINVCVRVNVAAAINNNFFVALYNVTTGQTEPLFAALDLYQGNGNDASLNFSGFFNVTSITDVYTVNLTQLSGSNVTVSGSLSVKYEG